MPAFQFIYVFIIKYRLNFKNRFLNNPLKNKLLFLKLLLHLFCTTSGHWSICWWFRAITTIVLSIKWCIVSTWVFYLYGNGCGFAGHCHCQKPSDTDDTCGGKTGHRWHTGISQPLQQENKAHYVSLSQCAHLMAKLFIAFQVHFFFHPFQCSKMHSKWCLVSRYLLLETITFTNHGRGGAGRRELCPFVTQFFFSPELYLKGIPKIWPSCLFKSRKMQFILTSKWII